MKEILILTGLCAFIAIVAIAAFKEKNNGFKFKNKPDFKPLKLDKEKINEHTKI